MAVALAATVTLLVPSAGLASAGRVRVLAGPSKEGQSATPLHWTKGLSIGGTLNDVSCSTRNFCMAVGAGGAAYAFVSGAWYSYPYVDPGKTQSPKTWKTLTSVSCPKVQRCVAIDNTGNAFYFRSGYWSSGHKVTTGRLQAIDCPTPKWCVAAGAGARVFVYSNDAWSSGETLNSTRRYHFAPPLRTVSCPTSRFCATVGTVANAYVLQEGTWSGGQLAASKIGVGPDAVSCPSAGSCVALNSDGQVFRYSNDNWGEVRGLPFQPIHEGNVPYVSLSCPTTKMCFAGYGVLIYQYSGGVWKRTYVTQTTKRTFFALAGVSCPSTTFCMAVNDQGFAFGYGVKKMKNYS
jgi:hypothetical protein